MCELCNAKVYVKTQKIMKKEKYEDLCKWIQKRYLYETIKKETEEWLKKNYDGKTCPLFSSIEIEVINRCNGECPFCPVNRHIDPRKLRKMASQSMVSGRRFPKDIRSGWNWNAMIRRSGQSRASGKPSSDQAAARRPSPSRPTAWWWALFTWKAGP